MGLMLNQRALNALDAHITKMNQDKYELLELTDDYDDEKKHSEFGKTVDELEENNPDSPLFNFISIPYSRSFK